MANFNGGKIFFTKEVDESYLDFIQRVKKEIQFDMEIRIYRTYIIQDKMSTIEIDGINDPILDPVILETRVLSDLDQFGKTFDHEAEAVCEREVSPADSIGMHISTFCKLAVNNAYRMCRLWLDTPETRTDWKKVVLFVEFNGANVEIPNIFVPNAAELLEAAIIEEMNVRAEEYKNSDEYKEKQQKEQEKVAQLRAMVPIHEEALASIPQGDLLELCKWTFKYAQLADRVGVSNALNIEKVKLGFVIHGIHAGMNVGLDADSYKNDTIRRSWILGQFIELLMQERGVPNALFSLLEKEMEPHGIKWEYL